MKCTSPIGIRYLRQGCNEWGFPCSIRTCILGTFRLLILPTDWKGPLIRTETVCLAGEIDKGCKMVCTGASLRFKSFLKLSRSPFMTFAQVALAMWGCGSTADGAVGKTFAVLSCNGPLVLVTSSSQGPLTLVMVSTPAGLRERSVCDAPTQMIVAGKSGQD